ncbi:MAG: GNAT family N-acetyltransferase [Bermanella sp.]
MSISKISETSWNEIMEIQEQAYTELPPEDIDILKSKWLSSPNTCAIYENSTNKILAYLLAHPWASETPPKLYETAPITLGPNLYLHDLALAHEARGKGIAKILVEHLIESAKNENLVKILLVAVQGSAEFWARFGFLEIPNREICPSYGDDAKLMALELKE